MKDELKGNVIDGAYLVGLKKYAYFYLNKFREMIIKSKFTGIPTNSLTIQDLHSLNIFNQLTLNLNRFQFIKNKKSNIIRITIYLEDEYDTLYPAAPLQY
jgi:hypothetical protein